MVKRIAMVLLSLCLVTMGVFAGGGSQASEAPKVKFKIGVMSSTISQSEESFRAAEVCSRQYPGQIVHMTYPEKFTTEQETTISTMLSMAADPDIKAIVCTESVVGTAAAFAKVKEVRPDILLVAGLASDDPRVLAGAADVAYITDLPQFYIQLADAAKEMGAKTFIYYSFPRHQARDPIAKGRVALEETCKKYGIRFVFTTVPDPMSDAGVAGSQQFILEDVKRKVAEYGKDTAFFSTNIGQAEPLVKATLETKSIFTMPSDPSPFTAFPGALGISIPNDKIGDAAYIEGEISRILKENGMSGRMGLWSVPLLSMFLRGGVEYAIAYLNGEFTNRNDSAQLKKGLERAASGAPVGLRPYEIGDNETLSNFYYVLGTFKTL